jgi:hypothetical protein
MKIPSSFIEIDSDSFPSLSCFVIFKLTFSAATISCTSHRTREEKMFQPKRRRQIKSDWLADDQTNVRVNKQTRPFCNLHMPFQPWDPLFSFLTYSRCLDSADGSNMTMHKSLWPRLSQQIKENAFSFRSNE